MKEYIRSDWKIEELHDLHALPLMELISKANYLHALYHKPGEIQLCTLLSIKTGGCAEDCRYCAQSTHYNTAVTPEPLMKYEQVMEEAKRALDRGATRFCMAVGWRHVKNGHAFNEILRMVKDINALGLEVCTTLGMLNLPQAQALKDAGLYAYNHNIDTSERFYPSIITTRTFQDRIDTLDILDKIGMSVCCGGILGLGETAEDRLSMLHTLCTRSIHPDSVPINRLTPIPGTPLQDQPQLSIWEMCRMIAITRLVMPKAMVRLSSGRQTMSFEDQALCFLAGANSIHMGEKLLTIANKPVDKDTEMFALLELTPRPAYEREGKHAMSVAR